MLFKIVPDHWKEKKAFIFYNVLIKTLIQNGNEFAQKENYKPIRFMNMNKQISYIILLRRTS